MFGLQPTSHPVTSVVSVAEQKSHMRLQGRDANDADVLAYLLFAEEYVTSLTNHVFQARTYRLTIDRPPAQYGYRFAYAYGGFTANSIELPYGPLISVETVSYKTLNAGTGLYVENVISPLTYQTSSSPSLGRVIPRSGAFWPFGSVFALEGMTLDFTAGYSPASSCPQTARMAIKLLAANMYENREPLINANVVGQVPLTLKHLTDNLKLAGYV